MASPESKYKVIGRPRPEDIGIRDPIVVQDRVIELSLELVSEPQECWGEISAVFASVEDLRLERSESFDGGPWSPADCNVGRYVAKSLYGNGSFFKLDPDLQSDSPRFVLRCEDNSGDLSPWPLEIIYEVRFSGLESFQRFNVYSELSNFRN